MRYGFFIFMLTLFTALVVYITLRGCQVLKDCPVGRTIYLVGMIFLFISFFVGTLAGGVMPLGLGKIIAYAGHTGLILFIYLFAAFLLTDIIRILNHFFHFAPEGMLLFRKVAFGVSALLIAIVLIVGNYKFNHPQIVKLDVNLERNAPQNKSLKIVAVSDIHLGVTIDKKRLNKYVELINNQHPDVVLIAGDICDNMLAPIEKQQMNEDLRKIVAPLGVYAIPGNHEYISQDINKAVKYLESGGITVLQDDIALVNDDFYIIGRDDRTNHNRKSLKALKEGLDDTKMAILLDHQPYHLEEAQENLIDLQISGHTHDGQFFPVNLIVRNMYENAHGYSRRGDTHYYVSSGLGIWGPQYRIGTQSELVVINLTY